MHAHLAQLNFMKSDIRGTKHRLTEKNGNTSRTNTVKVWQFQIVIQKDKNASNKYQTIVAHLGFDFIVLVSVLEILG